MKIAYNIGLFNNMEAENYNPTCKGRNLNCRLTIENEVIGHAKAYISPSTGEFKIMEQTLKG